MGKFIRHLWSVVCWIVLSGLVAAVGAALVYYQRADVQLREYLERRLQAVYPDLSVRVGSAQIVQGEGIRLHQVTLSRAAHGRAERLEVAYAEHVTLGCDTSLPSLLQGRITLDHVGFDGATLRLQLDDHGIPDWRVLHPRLTNTPLQNVLPRVVIENGVIELHEPKGGTGPPRILRAEGIQVRMRWEPTTKRPSHVPATFANSLLAVEATMRTNWCRQVTAEGIWRGDDQAWAVRGQVEQLMWSEGLAQQLPAAWNQACAKWSAARGTVDGQFTIRGQGRNQIRDWACRGHLRQGAWQCDQLAQPVSEVESDFELTEEGWKLTQAQGRFGEARWSGEATGEFGTGAPNWRGECSFEQLTVTARQVERWPVAIRDRWNKARPEGRFAGKITLAQQDATWKVDADVRCEDMSVTYHKFPYPVTQCVGSASWHNNTLAFDLQGQAGATPVTLQGTIHNPGPQFTGTWDVKTTRWKSIDEGLIAALPAGASQIVRDLQVRGEAGCWAHLDRPDPSVKSFPQVIIAVRDAWVNYRQFAYPISRIHGEIEWVDGRWTFEKLEGWNDGCHITCHGSWLPEDPERPLELEFVAQDLSLDTELRQALPEPSQKVWAQLRPQGQLAELKVGVWKTQSMARPDVEIQVKQPVPQTEDEEELGPQIQPLFFPLPLQGLSGEAHLQGREIVLRDLRAHRGPLTVQAQGIGERLQAGGWTLRLTDIIAERVQFDRDLLEAMPPRLAQSLQRLQVDGSWGLTGGMHYGRESSEAPLTSGWNLTLNIEQGRMACGGLPLEAIFGQIALRGGSQGDRFWTHGQLQLDSLMSQRIQFTKISGPLWIDADRVVLGQKVPPARSERTSAPLTATVYQGKVAANVEMSLGDEANFQVQANLTNADMGLMARDWRLGQGNLAGKAFLEIALAGNRRGRHTWRGEGTGQLRDANLGELPLVLALLNRLSSGRTDNTAFTSSDVGFHIKDDYVYFDRLDLSGDAMTLKGVGEMSLNRELDLDFYTIMGQEQLWSPLVRPFLGEASRQFLLIHVNGTLNDPKTHQEVLPGLNDTLRQLFPEQAEATAERRNPSGRGPYRPR